MQGRQLFEYAVIRVVPRVEREEFMNVGVILYCRGEKFLQARFGFDEQRLQAFANGTDLGEIKENLLAFCRICEGHSHSGPIGRLSPPERFRWLTAIRSTAVQTSRVHPGFCTNAEDMLNHLFAQLVL